MKIRTPVLIDFVKTRHLDNKILKSSKDLEIFRKSGKKILVFDMDEEYSEEQKIIDFQTK